MTGSENMRPGHSKIVKRESKYLELGCGIVGHLGWQLGLAKMYVLHNMAWLLYCAGISCGNILSFTLLPSSAQDPAGWLSLIFS